MDKFEKQLGENFSWTSREIPVKDPDADFDNTTPTVTPVPKPKPTPPPLPVIDFKPVIP